MSILESINNDDNKDMYYGNISEEDLLNAARLGNLRTLRSYLKQGGRLDFQNHNTLMTPIHVAAQYGHLEFIKCAIEAESFFVDTEDRYYRQPFDVARDYGHRDIMQALYKYAWGDADPVMDFARLTGIIPIAANPKP